MNADVLDLRDFYASRLGLLAQRHIQLALAPLWRPVAEERLLGFGYALPYLDRFAGDAERSLAFMPAAQGVMNWPVNGPSRTALVPGEALPLANSVVDRILMIHALEFAENPHAMLAEMWRVLAPGGRLIIVVPNRRGVWTRFDNTPFGAGRPWSRGQLSRLLREALFVPSAWSDALLFPPFRRKAFLRLAGPMERLGRDLWPVFSGVIIMEATKQLYRGIPAADQKRERQRAAQPVLVPQGATCTRR